MRECQLWDLIELTCDKEEKTKLIDMSEYSVLEDTFNELISDIKTKLEGDD